MLFEFKNSNWNVGKTIFQEWFKISKYDKMEEKKLDFKGF